MAYKLNGDDINHGYTPRNPEEQIYGSLDGPQHNDWVHYRMLNLAGADLLECERTPIQSGEQTASVWDAVTCPHCVTSLAQSWAGFCEFAPPLDPKVYHSALEDTYDAPSAESLGHLWDGAVPAQTLEDDQEAR